MRRTWILAALAVVALASAAAYQRGSNWKEYEHPATRLMADLGKPDALIRTASLSRLPRDLLRVPIARDVLTEDFLFYYEQHEDRLGFRGALKRIAYEHELTWSDKLVAMALDEPAEMALWRDGRGALRHYALVIRRGALAKVVEEAGAIALKDKQLKRAGQITTPQGKATVYSLEVNPRRTFLIVAQGERTVILSDPGLLYAGLGTLMPDAEAAVAQWLTQDRALARRFALADSNARHTLAIGGESMSLGYGAFLSGFRGLRFDFGDGWSTHVWVDPAKLPPTGLADAALWKAAPAGAVACLTLPIDWVAARKVLLEADQRNGLPEVAALRALEGSGLACWYGDATLQAPVFIGRLSKAVPKREEALRELAWWALGQDSAVADIPAVEKGSKTPPSMVWRSKATNKEGKRGRPFAPVVASRGDYVVFSPDGELADRVLDTLARKHPSVADEMPTSHQTLAYLAPHPLSHMAGNEMMAALSGAEATLREAASTHLPKRLEALATYPAYRLELSGTRAKAGWQPLEWRTQEAAK